ncbi:non-homologous end-joining DNA ligase [Herbidospora mongoliensis]|uniref:non-homologous end-joining DNA ligase n=1 Tax=Herbidospora mongoliensis TaxID=688067 RepID=UPI000A6F41F1|nr:non-homologous end-joining DNA ligase [Herbidospora mongoliensis]
MALPYPVEPMLAVPGALPSDGSRYVLEVKWDGIRVVAYLDGEPRLFGRKGVEVTRRYPEVGSLKVPRDVVLDGEVVAFDHEGKPSFELIQRRMNVGDPGAHGLLGVVPVTYMPFDLLSLDGATLLDRPYRERRELLESLGITVAPTFPCHPDVLAATREQGLEGVVAKHVDSRYRPGARSPWWIKVKNLVEREVVIGGWRPGRGRRSGGIGSLLMGAFGPDGFVFLGHVGTGFSDAALDELFTLLAPLEIARSAYTRELPREIVRDAHWVRPALVGEVTYANQTTEGRLRAPAWRGLRPDKIPAEVRL